MAGVSQYLTVKVGFGSTPLTALASITWTDITSSVMLSEGVSFSRGRAETDTVARPGSLSLALDNSTQSGGLNRYATTPVTWGSSTKWADTSRSWTGYPDFDTVPLVKRMPIRVSYNGTIDLWTGYIESIVYGWREGFRPVVRITATDRLARLQKKTLPSLILGEQLRDSPTVVWPLDDDIGTTSAGDRSGNSGKPSLSVKRVGSTGTLTFGSDTTAGGPGYAPGPDDAYCANFAPTSATVGKYLYASGVGGGTSDTAQSVEAYFKAATTADGMVFAQHYSDLAKQEIGIIGGKIVWRAAFTGKTPATATITGPSIQAGVWYHVVVTSVKSGSTTTVRLYVNGLFVDSTTHAEWANLGRAFNMALVGCTVSLSTSDIPVDLLFSGLIANVAIYRTQLDAAPIATHAAARYTPASYTAEAASTKFAAACRIASLSSADVLVSPGSTSATMAPVPAKGRPLTDVLNDIAQAEGGVIYLDGSGVLTFAPRSARYNTPSVVSLPATLVDKGTEFTDDLSFLVNDVTVGRASGATARAVNASSVASYDTHDMTISNVYVDTDAQVVDLATWYANLNAQPTPRVNDVTIDMVTADGVLGASSPYVWDLQPGDHFQVTSLPGSAPSSTLDLFVEGISDQVSTSSWVRRIVTSPVGPMYTVMALDDASLGLLDGTAGLGL